MCKDPNSARNDSGHWSRLSRPVRLPEPLRSLQLAASPLQVGESAGICLLASDLTELDASAKSIRVLREHQQAEEALRNVNEDLRAHAEQLQTGNDMLESKQSELEEANEQLREPE